MDERTGSIGVNLQAGPPDGHVAAVADAIVAVLGAVTEGGHDQSTAEAALETLKHTTRVENVTIQSCSIQGDVVKTVRMDEPSSTP